MIIARQPPQGQVLLRTINPNKVPFQAAPGAEVQTIALPQRYYDWALMLAHFPASAAAVRTLLPEDSGLEPVTIAPGFGLVTLGAFDYRQPDTLAPYHEVGVMVPVRYRPTLSLPALPLLRPEWFRDLGFFIWQLPVTTPQACDAGRALWNFPKSVAQITFAEAGNRRRCTWSTLEGKHVLTLDVRTSQTTQQVRNFLAYSTIEERLQETLVQSVGEFDESMLGLDASFSLGEGEVADRLRGLGMLPVPVGRLYSPKAAGFLPGPSPVPFASVPAILKVARRVKARTSRAVQSRRKSSVAILGGGVAGLSAAHELAERGFKVTVYEQRGEHGGKARSFLLPPRGGRLAEPLPAEHGFRFFPGFYRHLPDTMARIPYGKVGTVADNLVTAVRLTVDFDGDASLVFPARLPVSVADVNVLLSAVGLLQERTGCTPAELSHYIERVWQLMTSCKERRLEEYEKQDWWSYIGAGERSRAYQRLARTTRTLVAADPRSSSTRTVGSALLQLLFDFATPGGTVDRVLNGPTSEVWISPWIARLKTLGVEFVQATVRRIDVKHGKVSRVVIEDAQGGRGPDVTADHYIAAVPVERMAEIVERSKDLLEVDRGLGNILDLRRDVETMAGVQFYFTQPLPLENGHFMHLDSEWALTSLAQAQFWKRSLTDYGDGSIRDILSVDISDFKTVGGRGRRANESSREEIVEEVWRQLATGLPVLHDIAFAGWSLDPALTFENDKVENAEPLLVNHENRWHLRPKATTALPNLFLAADYVQTYTDLATMEGANEAARRAVNAILDASPSTAAPCELWDLHEPTLFAPWRWIDRNRYRMGMPWNSDFPLALRGLELGMGVVHAVTKAVGLGRVREPAKESASAVPPRVRDEIATVLEEFVRALKGNDRAKLDNLFAPWANVTIGLEQARAADYLEGLTGGVDLSVQAIQRLYRRGPFVHVVMSVRLREDGGDGQPVDGHVHVIMVDLGATPDGGEQAPKWVVSSLRYRRAGKPARRETPPGWTSRRKHDGRRRWNAVTAPDRAPRGQAGAERRRDRDAG